MYMYCIQVCDRPISQMYHTGALVVSSNAVLLPALAAATKLVTGVLYVPLVQVSSFMHACMYLYTSILIRVKCGCISTCALLELFV